MGRKIEFDGVLRGVPEKGCRAAWRACILCVILAVLISPFGCRSREDTGGEVPSRWVTDFEGSYLPEVKPGNEKSIPFEMQVGRSVSSLRLEIVEEEFREMGVSIPAGLTDAANGTVSTIVRFAVMDGTPARRYVMTIRARDAVTQRVIATTEIPFAVYPYFFELYRCYC